MIMDRLYGGVCYAGIDTDPELKYPKGAGRVAFSNQQSYIAAISARFVQLQHGEIDKRVSGREKKRAQCFSVSPLGLRLSSFVSLHLTSCSYSWRFSQLWKGDAKFEVFVVVKKKKKIFLFLLVFL